MSTNYNFWYPLFAFLFYFVTVLSSAEFSPSFGYKKFDKDSKFFNSQISLFGDAKVEKIGSFVQFTGSWNYSVGRVVYKQPIKLQYGGKNPRNNKASFGTYFVFSMSPENGDGLAFVILRNGNSADLYNGQMFGLSDELTVGKNRKGLFAVEFDTKLDPMYKDLNDNHVGVNIGSLVSVKVMNVSDVKMRLNSGDKHQCWIDYEASSKRIEVRLSKWGQERPFSPLISYTIDLSEMFKDEKVYIGLSSSNANSTQVCKLHSWSFKLRKVPIWMHSQPLDPEYFRKDEGEPVATTMHKRSDCILRVLTALVFGTGCGALGAFIVLCAWTAFINKKPVVPEEFAAQPVIFDYDKVKVIVVDKSGDVKK